MTKRKRLKEAAEKATAERRRAETALASAKQAEYSAITAWAALACADGHDWTAESQFFPTECRRCGTFKDEL